MRGLVVRLPAYTRYARAGAAVRAKYNRAVLGGLSEAIGDLTGGLLDAAGTALKDVGKVADELTGAHSAAPPGIPTGDGTGSSATGGWISTHPEPPHPTYTPPASGGDKAPDPAPPARPQDPQPPAATPATSASAPSAQTQPSSGSRAGAATAAPLTSTPLPGAVQKMNHSPEPGADEARTKESAPLAHWNTASSTHPSPTGALAGGAGKPGKGFPLAAAAALGCVLGLLVLCAAVWLYRSKRRRRAARAHPHPKRTMSLISATTVSTVPLFISAREAGVADENPFRHPRDADTDEEEEDPFHPRTSWWSASTTRSASTISV